MVSQLLTAILNATPDPRTVASFDETFTVTPLVSRFPAETR